VIAKGRLRGEKIRYTDGVGVCIWIPLEDDEGPCFDLLEEDLDDLILLLKELKRAENYEECHGKE